MTAVGLRVTAEEKLKRFGTVKATHLLKTVLINGLAVLVYTSSLLQVSSKASSNTNGY